MILLRKLVTIIVAVTSFSVAQADPIASILEFTGTNGSDASLVWNESINGDLGTSFRSPEAPLLDLGLGLNIVAGSWFFDTRGFGVVRDFDSFNFLLPENSVLSGVVYAFDVAIEGNLSSLTDKRYMVSDIDCYDCFLDDPFEFINVSRTSTEGTCRDENANTIPCPWDGQELDLSTGSSSAIFDLDFDGSLPRSFTEQVGGISWGGTGGSGSFLITLNYAWGVSVTTVPEPGTLVLLGLGLAGMGLARRRKV